MKAQALRDSSSQSYMSSKKTMELNPKNSIIEELRKKVAADKADVHVKNLIWLLFDTSLLLSGFSLDDPSVYGNRIFRMVKLSLGALDEEPTTSNTTTVSSNEKKEEKKIRR